MLDLMDVLKLMAEGKKLPQEGLPRPTDQEIDLLQEAEPRLLNLLFEEGAQGDPAEVIMRELRKLTAEHHWFVVTGILCMAFGHRYRPETIPALGEVKPETMNLLRMLPLSVEHSAGGDEGAWTVPMAILADMGEEEALGFTACAGLCAAVGFFQSSMAEGS
ncbi:hypothetical protein SEA_SATIS_243 [Streptomyces phage Satis]|nr:hypothetical protein SEA_SATIS_243 [Streptomyces phage Satis]QBZ72130.1 hypothetical protein SEA_KRADAL_244 [Streptomyces phage Kradal]QPL14551.1 hypothetical protein SEA_EHYELIMAYOE_246 [Streptomyces phage EhyElimayoE]